MKFLLDQDVYVLTERFLREQKYDVVTASELGLSRAQDSVYDHKNRHTTA